MAKEKKNPVKLEAKFIMNPRYREVAKALSGATKKGVQRFGEAVAERARTSPRTPRDTGALAESITSSVRKIANEKDQFAVSVRTGVGKGGQRYGGRVTIGSPITGTPPRPFLVWALEDEIPNMKAIFQEEAKAAEKEVPAGPKGPQGRDGKGRFT